MSEPWPRRVGLVGVFGLSTGGGGFLHGRLLYALQGQASVGQGHRPLDFRFLICQDLRERTGVLGTPRLHPERNHAKHEFGILDQV